jgi:TonB family protein
VRNLDPLLSMEPALLGIPQIIVPAVDMSRYGDPNGVPGPPSNGPGTRGGIGSGDGGGVGPRRGLGTGPDADDGGLSGASGIRGSITAPLVLWKVEPEYSDEARRARLQGTVILYIEVDTDGRPRNFSVRQSLGLGLDERAIEAVRQWKFRAGTHDGRPIVTAALVKVYFRLL